MKRDVLQRPSSNLPASRRAPGWFPGGAFNELFGQFLGEHPISASWSEVTQAAMDVSESENAFEVKLDLPGVSPEDVDIQVDQNTLMIRGKREETVESDDNDDRQFHRMERFRGNFARSIVLPSAINDDEAVAEFKDGVLKIVIPKADQARPKRISITK